jgi:hypothetical protein
MFLVVGLCGKHVFAALRSDQLHTQDFRLHCKKKVSGFPVPSQDVTNRTLPGRE